MEKLSASRDAFVVNVFDEHGEQNLNQNTLKLILSHFHTYKKYFDSESDNEVFNG